MLRLAILKYRVVVISRVNDSNRSSNKAAGCQIGQSGRCVLDARAELPMRACGGNAGGQGVDAQVVVGLVDGRHDGERAAGYPFRRLNGEMAQ